MKSNCRRNHLIGGHGFGASQPEHIPHHVSIAAGRFEVVFYDKNRCVRVLLESTEDCHPGDLIGTSADAGVLADLDHDTLQGTAKAKDEGWLISWVLPGQTDEDLKKKLGKNWSPLLGKAS